MFLSGLDPYGRREGKRKGREGRREEGEEGAREGRKEGEEGKKHHPFTFRETL